MADAARGEPDERLARLRLGELDLLDGERLPELLEHGGADPHGRDRTPRRLTPSALRSGWADTDPEKRQARQSRRADVKQVRQRAAATGSTRTADTLYSGVPISGSPTSCVSQFTFACAKWSAIQTRPG